MEMHFGTIATLMVVVGFLNKGEAVTSVQFSAAEQAPYDSVDAICVGEKSIVKVHADFPVGVIEAVFVEILPSLQGTVLSIGDIIDVQAGQSISVENSSWQTPVLYAGATGCLDSMGMVEYKTRAVFNLGTVTTSSQYTAEADTRITFEFEVVMVCMDGQVNNAEIWNSAGMMYANGQYIWISQNSYTICDTPKSVATSPAFTLNPGDTAIELGGTETFQLTANIPNPVTALRVSALITDDTPYAYIASLQLKTIPKAYRYSIVDQTVMKGYETCPVKSILELSYSSIINKESQAAGSSPVTSDSDLVFELMVHVVGGDVGATYNLGLAIEIGPDLQNLYEIYVTSVLLTVIPGSVPNLSTITLPPGLMTVQGNQPGYVTLDLIIPKNSWHEYTVTITTAPLSGATKALDILAVFPTSYGVNLPCPIPDTVKPTIGADRDTATYIFNISNYGFSGASQDDDKLSLNLVFFVTSHGIQGEQHQLSVTVTHDEVSIGPETTTIEVGPPATLPNSVNFAFVLTNSHTTSEINPGGSVLFDLKVTTEPGVTSGDMVVEFPVPIELETANPMSICSAKLTGIGANVLCLQPGELTYTDVFCCTNTTIKNATKWARVVIPMVCNLDTGSTDAEKDSFHIAAVVKVDDSAATLQSTAFSTTFSIGAKYSVSQLFVGSKQITLTAQDDLSDPLIVQSLTVPNTEFDADWLNLYDVQFSADKLQYHSNTFSWTAVDEGAQTKLTPSFPILTQYPRLTSKVCKPITTNPTPTFITEPTTGVVELYGETAQVQVLKNHIMLSLDKNRETCFTLPHPTKPDFPSSFWLKMATTFLKLSGSEAYSVKVIGKGLDCNRHGQQNVTQVLYPTVSLTNRFYGKMRHCQSQLGSGSPDGEDRIVCHYHCNCNDAMTCGHLIIFILSQENIGDNDFQLCELEVAAL